MPRGPVQNLSIVSGETYYDCTIYTTSDVDSFQFAVTAASTWSIVAGLGPAPSADICMALYTPGVPLTLIFTGCTDIADSIFSIATNQKMTVDGPYTIAVTGLSNSTVTYNLSLERTNPAPPDGVPLLLGRVITSEVSPPTAQDAFTFYACKSGEYQLTVRLAPVSSSDVCVAVYQPNGTAVVPGSCTDVESGVISVQADLIVQNGTYVVVIYAAGNDSTVGYNLEISCLAGNCSCRTEGCVLDDSLSYASGTLTMNFTVGTPYDATWNAWLISRNTSEFLWSQSQPTEPPVAVTRTQAGAASGTVGVLSILTTPAKGIACSSLELVNTGKP